MKVYPIDIFFWRYALRKLEDFPFYHFSCESDILEMVYSSLKNEVISEWLDKLLNRRKGYHSQLLSCKKNSKSNRAFNYISKILISTVIKNDTGIQGAISPIYMNAKEKINGEYETEFLFTYPQNVKILNINEDHNMFEIIKHRNSIHEYIIPFDHSNNRKEISKKLRDKINNDSIELIKRMFSEKKIKLNSDCIFFAIDYFIISDNIVPLEWHYPGRGLGLHFLPLLSSKKSILTFSIILDKIKSILTKTYGNNTILLHDEIPKLPFHELDKLFVLIFNNQMDDDFIEIRIMLDESEKSAMNFHNRLFFGGRDLIPYKIISNKVSLKELEEIQEDLGFWVIVKQLSNLPWWKSERLKPEIHLANSNLRNRLDYLVPIYGPLIIQKVISNSVDKNKHFGELRSYLLITNES